MRKLFYVTMLFSTLLIIGCIPTPGTTVIDKTKWVYKYIYNYGFPNVYYTDTIGSGIKDSVFTYPLYTENDPDLYSHQNYEIKIPSQISIYNTDNLRLVISAKNTNNNDIGVYLVSNDTIMGANWAPQTRYLPFARLQVGSQLKNNLVELNGDAYSYRQLEIILTSNSITAKTNSAQPVSMNYVNLGVNKINSIRLASAGNRTSIDWVKLYKGSKLIMTEDFNTAGQTTAKWTLP